DGEALSPLPQQDTGFKPDRLGVDAGAGTLNAQLQDIDPGYIDLALLHVPGSVNGVRLPQDFPIPKDEEGERSRDLAVSRRTAWGACRIIERRAGQERVRCFPEAIPRSGMSI